MKLYKVFGFFLSPGLHILLCRGKIKIPVSGSKFTSDLFCFSFFICLINEVLALQENWKHLWFVSARQCGTL